MLKFDDCPDVRLAEPSDEDGVMRLLRLAHREAGEHPISEDKVRTTVQNGVYRNYGLIGVVGDVGHALKASILICVAPVWYSDDFQLMELSSFVHPNHRRSTYARQLIAFGKHCADNLGMSLMIGVFSNERTAAKVRLYRQQLPERGAFFCHQPVKAA